MFHRDEEGLGADGVPLADIAARVGTPAYVYSWPAIEARYRLVESSISAAGGAVRYAVKANGSLGILARLAGLGAGFDIVSGGELERVMRAGGDPGSVVFSGVGKSEAEIDFAIKAGIECFNIESAPELDRIEARAALLGAAASVSVRVNPDVDAGAHPYIATGMRESKFGVAPPLAMELYARIAASDSLAVAGIDCHIGSQIADVAPFEASLARLLDLAGQLAAAGIELRHVDVGGGFGVSYAGEKPFDIAAFGAMLARRLAGTGLRPLVEPGRFLVADAGILLTRVEYLKETGERNFAIVDAAMNDLLRPALYSAWHDVEPVLPERGSKRRWDIVGPVCESGDFLALERDLALEAGDLVAIRGAGAYGFVLSSNYNARPRAPEVLVDAGDFHVIRRRETPADMLRLERVR